MNSKVVKFGWSILFTICTTFIMLAPCSCLHKVNNRSNRQSGLTNYPGYYSDWKSFYKFNDRNNDRNYPYDSQHENNAYKNYPSYDPNRKDFRLEEYNPYDFNKINPEYKRRRPKEFADSIRPPVDVKTSYGRVSGYHVFLYDGPQVPIEDRPHHQTLDKVYKNVTVFKGIPYAEKPIDDKRFKPPEPIQRNWGSIDARRYAPVCPQHNDYIGQKKGNIVVDEDCLYLNIYTPSAREGLKELYPVMIYIHGGFFSHGSANRFPAYMLSASMDVVVVTFNYRLGVLGYFSTGDEVSPGNYGLLDQALAVEWISNNIRAFNGDANRITLFGPGAGAASAGLLALSSKTKDLFQRIIAQSGSMLAEWAVTLDPEFARNTTRIYGQKVGCATGSSHSLVNCLRSRRAAELVNAEIKPEVGWLPWTPIVDWYTQEHEHRILKDIPIKLLQNSEIKSNLDYMCGVTTEEAALMLLKDKILKHKSFEIDEKILDAKVRDYIKMYNYTLNPEGVFNAIKFMYTPWSDAKNKTLLRESYIQMLTDSYFVAPVIKLNHMLLDNDIQPYMYVLNTTLQSLNKPKWHGVMHDTEYFYITGAPFMDPEFYPEEFELSGVKWTDQDRNMSELFMKTWTNFAKHGNPNRPTNSFGIRWDKMADNNLQFLSLNTTNNTYSYMQRDYKERESAFWTEYIPQLIDRILPTWAPTEEPWHEERRIIRASLWGMVAAAGLFFILMLICCALYCSKKRTPKYMDDDQLPHYHAPYMMGTQKSYLNDDVTVNKNAATNKEQHTSV